jgi:phosphate transport system substrate-binding protein
MSKKMFAVMAVLAIAAMFVAACAPAAPAAEEVAPAEEVVVEEMAEPVEGDVLVDGSSTVYPITVAVAEEFAPAFPDVRVSVGLSGTGGGFKKFCIGEIDISDASRRIKDEENELCQQNNIEWTEFFVATDGLTVMVNPENDWVTELTPLQIAEILGANSTIVKWSDIDASYPNETIKFFIPDPDSGTRDYMVEVVEKQIETEEDLRQDANTTFSSDDNVLLDGISNELYSFGFFGYAYYVNNTDKVKAVAVVNKDGVAVMPSDETVQDGSYNPLARPLFIYANNASATSKLQVAEFLKFYFSEAGAPSIMAEVGYSMPPDGTYETLNANLRALLGE